MKLPFGRELTILVSASLIFGTTSAVRQLQAQSTLKDAPQTRPARSESNQGESPIHQHQHDGTMPGMDMEDDTDSHAQAGAMQSMNDSHHMEIVHIRMTPVRSGTAEEHILTDEIA